MNDVKITESLIWTERTERLVETAIAEGGPVEVLRQLAAVGLLIQADYERPTLEDLYHRLAHIHRASIRWRWVMCRETHDWLAATYANVKWASGAFIIGGVQIGLLIEPNTEQPSKLMGADIRVDPAARRVMFELVETP